MWLALTLLFGAPVLLVVLDASPLGPSFWFTIFGVPCLVLLWLLGGVLMATSTGRFAARRHWRPAAISTIPVLVVVASLGWPLKLIHICNYAGNAIYFLLVQPGYRQQLRDLPPLSEPRLVVFDRGGMSWASEGYAYDESDEIARPPGTQSVAWKKRANDTPLSCGYGSRPLWSHFYVVYLSC